MIGKEPVGVSLSLFYNAIKDKSRRKVNCAKNTGGDFPQRWKASDPFLVFMPWSSRSLPLLILIVLDFAEDQNCQERNYY